MTQVKQPADTASPLAAARSGPPPAPSSAGRCAPSPLDPPAAAPASARGVHPALLLLGLGQPASPEDAAGRAATEPALSPAQPAFLLLGLTQTAGPAEEATVVTTGVNP